MTCTGTSFPRGSHRKHLRAIFLTALVCGGVWLADAGESRIDHVTITSTALGIQKSFNIFLPKDYDQSTERYPVLYLLRGHEREWAEPNQDGSIAGMTIKILIDTLQAQGLVGNIIVVMPGLSSEDNTVPAFAVNFLRVDLAGSKVGLGTGQFEDYLLQELMPYVDRTYRTLPDRYHRGVDGFSFGGFTSMSLATKHPTRFCSAGGYDGTLMWLDFVDQYQGGQDFWAWDTQFDPQFGSPRNIPYMAQYNASNNVKYGSASYIATLAQTQFLIHAATSISGNNLNRNLHFVSLLSEKGIPNGFSEITLSPSAVHNWYFAYMHMTEALPLHFQKFTNAPNTIALALAALGETGKIAGTVTLHWSHLPTADTLLTVLEYSRNGGATWNLLQNLGGADTSYAWNTATVPDGTRYLVRVTALNDTSFGRAVTPAPLTIDNPGNGAPDLAILSPQHNERVSGSYAITWAAADPEGTALSISLDGSEDGGITWHSLATGLPNSGSYTWDSRSWSNGPQERIRITCSDGVNTVADTSQPFLVDNQRAALADSLLRHVQGSGDGPVHIHVTDPSQMNGHTYRIVFDDTSSATTTYSVRDLSTDHFVVEKATELDGVSEGPLFDGLRLVLANYVQAIPDTHGTRWTHGQSTMKPQVRVASINPGGVPVPASPYASDYAITIYDHVVDTSLALFGVSGTPMTFSTRNITEGHRVDVLYIDLDENGTLSPSDFIYIFEKGSEHLLTWEVFFPATDPSPLPQPGDTLLLKFFKPFTAQDVFEFTSVTTDVAAGSGREPGTYALLQNYPNPFNPTTLIGYRLPVESKVTLLVYDVLGREVTQLVNGRQAPGVYGVPFDARKLASGVYFYRLRAMPVSGRAGEFVATQKMLLIR